MFFDTVDCTGPSTCRRCGFAKPSIVWPWVPRMPKVKEPKKESDNE